MKHYPIILPAVDIAWAKEAFQAGDYRSPITVAAMLTITQLRAVISQIENLFPADHPALNNALEWVDRVSQTLDEIEDGINAEERLNDADEAIEDSQKSTDDGWDSAPLASISEGIETLSTVLDDFEGCDAIGIDDETDEFIQRMVDYWLDDVLRKQGFNLLSILQRSVDPFAAIKSYKNLAGVTFGD